MLQFVCDSCGTLKRAGEIWINGVAAENVGTQAARREVVIDPAWRRERACLPFAVHFCSVECKDNYLAELFEKPLPRLEVRGAVVDHASGLRIVRATKKSGSNAGRRKTATSKRTG